MVRPAKVADTDNRDKSKVKQERLDEHKGWFQNVNIFHANSRSRRVERHRVLPRRSLE